MGWRLRENGLASAISEIHSLGKSCIPRRSKAASAVNISFCFFSNICYSQKFTLSYLGGGLFINIATASKLKKQQQKSELGNVLVFSVSIKILPHITPKSEHLFVHMLYTEKDVLNFLFLCPIFRQCFQMQSACGSRRGNNYTTHVHPESSQEAEGLFVSALSLNHPQKKGFHLSVQLTRSFANLSH